MSNKKNFYFTFGFGQKYEGYFVVIKTTSMDLARKQMFEKYGREWAFGYTEEQWNEDGISQQEKYNYKELKDGERS